MNSDTQFSRRAFVGATAALVPRPVPGAAPATVSVAQFGVAPDKKTDTTPAVRAALAEIRHRKSGRLVFPKGRYHFWPDRAAERYLYVSNNDDGLKRIAFPLFEDAGLTIDGQGSEFVFHGQTLPFVLDGVRNVALTNFSIDWEVPFHCEGEVLDADRAASSVDLRIPPPFSYRIEDGRFVFAGEGFDNDQLKNLLEWDPKRGESAFQTTDNLQRKLFPHARKIGEQEVRISAKFRSLPRRGNILLVLQDGRYVPAITIKDSREVRVEGVAIHHSGAMGIIGQGSADLLLRNVKVMPREGSGRFVSTTVDATHFVNCRGTLTIENCEFRNHIDDALNVHGIYGRISGIPTPGTLELELVHFQQDGIRIVDPGARIEFVHPGNLETFGEAVVQSVEVLNGQFSRVALRGRAPAGVRPGDVVQNLDAQPVVAVRGCVAGWNRARGFLIKSANRVLIERNRFHTPGSAILMNADATHWFESGPVKDLTIRENLFDDCNYGVWGRAVIEFRPGNSGGTGPAVKPFDTNVRIEDNVFRTFDTALVAAERVGSLRISGNRVERTSTYPKWQKRAAVITARHCPGLAVTGNHFAPGAPVFEIDAVSRQTAKLQEAGLETESK